MYQRRGRTVFIARAVLPMEADEGSKLKMENLQFEMA